MKLHELHDTDLGDESHEVWLDLEEPPLTGLCLGTGPTAMLALKDARQELTRVVLELDARIHTLESS